MIRTINEKNETSGISCIHVQTINKGFRKSNVPSGHKACGECQTSCQSACKTSCTVANQKCENQTGKEKKK